MGRAFEKRKARKEARWGKVAKIFVRIGKEVSIAVKSGGPDPSTNPRLRVAIQNAKGANMPKDRIESAIKKASTKAEGDLQELSYEGYAPNGVAIFIDAATDNPTRTVANLRSHFKKCNGVLGNNGSLEFLFDRMGVFELDPEGLDSEELEFELIDFGLEEIGIDDDRLIIYTPYTEFGNMQKALEERELKVLKSELQRIPHDFKELNEEQTAEVEKLLERLEDDDDVQNIFHNMA